MSPTKAGAKAPRKARKSRKRIKGGPWLLAFPLILISPVVLTMANPEFAVKCLGLTPVDITPLSSTVRIYDRYNHLTATICGDKDEQPIPLKEASTNLKMALLAAEDHDFYQHDGINPLSIIRAIFVDVTSRRLLQGGSTISQQLVKNLCHEGKKRDLKDKIDEAVLALELEHRYSKDKILEAYINHVYFGDGVYGAERASEHYFGKRCSQLSLAEAAYLAGIVNAPSQLSSPAHRQAAIARQKFILGRMQELGYAKPDAIKAAEKQKLVFKPMEGNANKYRYYTSEVLDIAKRELNLSDSNFYSRGLQIYTNLDCAAQAQAQRALTQGIIKAPKGINQGALVSISVPDGAVIAMVGGAGSYAQNQWNRALNPHTAGSAFKPFVYLAALINGTLHYDSLVEDAPLEIQQTGAPPYRPKNFDGQYLGNITVRQALAQSRNTCAVRVGEGVGAAKIVECARAAGIVSKLDESPALALGCSAVSPFEMANAYATLARNGQYVEPLIVRKISDANGVVLKEFEQRKATVLPQEPVAQLVDALQDVVEKGTGQRARLFDRPVAGKTGTSDQSKDLWFIGFTPDVVTAVWGGNDDNDAASNAATGGSVMAGIWHSYMSSYYQQHSVEPGSFVAPSQPLIQDPGSAGGPPPDSEPGLLDRLFGGETRKNPEEEIGERNRERAERQADEKPKKSIFKRVLRWFNF